MPTKQFTRLRFASTVMLSLTESVGISKEEESLRYTNYRVVGSTPTLDAPACGLRQATSL